MSSNGITVILDSNYYESLMNNRKMMIENIIFSQEMTNLCVEKKIVSGDVINGFKISEINAEKIDYIIQSLQMKQLKFFVSFCEILMMCGHPLIAQILQESATYEIEVDIEDLFNDMPMLKKSLRPKDKEQLQKYITNKAKMESMKAIVTHSKENNRKESIARVTQIQQSWKFQKDIKVKEKESDDLKVQLITIEDQLSEKQQQLKAIKQELTDKQRKQQEELLLSSNFNAVNDRELQRAENARNLYKKAMETAIGLLKFLIPENDKICQKLLHESSESQMKKYDVEKQVEIFETFLDTVLEIFNILRTENENFEILKKEVREIQRKLFAHREPSPSDGLTAFIVDYQKMIADTVKTLQSKLDLQDNFIFGRIPRELIPLQFRNIQIPSVEREEYTDIIKELRVNNRRLESMLAVKENEFKKFVSNKVSGEIEIFLDSNNTNGDDDPLVKSNSQSKQEPSQNTDSSMPAVSNGVPYSYTSKYKSRQPRGFDNKSKRNNVLKFGSVNFL